MEDDDDNDDDFISCLVLQKAIFCKILQLKGK